MKWLPIIFLVSFSLLASATENLRVVTEHLPPYQIVKNNKLIGGTSYFIMAEVFKRAGFKVKFEVLPWARAYHIALNEENVIIFSMTRSPEREDKFNWIGELRNLKYSFYALKSTTKNFISNIEQAKKYKMVAVRGSFEAESLLKLGFVQGQNLTLTRGYLEAWEMLLKGRADMTYANAIIGESIYKSLALNSDPFFNHSYIVDENKLYVAASKKTPESIVVKLTTALESLKKDGSFSAILINNI